MFMASKFEDIYPLKMKVVYNKIGHKKLAVEEIRSREQDILRVLEFKLGSVTPLEFLERYIDEIFFKHPDKDFIHLMSIYLSKLALHHDNLCYRKSSLLGTSSIYVALKICEQMKPSIQMTKEIFSKLLTLSGIKEKELIDCSKKLLYLA